jgi:hypothetical protein
MSWSIGFDHNWNRDIGYGVPAECDHPECDAEIDRGLSYVCGGQPYGEPHGCGLFFCDAHLLMKTVPGEPNIDGAEDEETVQLCERCPLADEHPDAFTPKPDVKEWTDFKATDPSWAKWRNAELDKPKERA